MPTKTLSTTLDAILLASLIATDDPHAESWEAVNFVRGMKTDHGPIAVGFGRGVVDSLPHGETFDVEAFVSDEDIDAVG